MQKLHSEYCHFANPDSGREQVHTDEPSEKDPASAPNDAFLTSTNIRQKLGRFDEVILDGSFELVDFADLEIQM